MPLFSIIIPTCNRPHELKHCLDSLYAQQNLCAYADITVVDDCSHVKYKGELRHLCNKPGCTLVEQPMNRGVACARNAGATKALGEWLAFLDDDVIVSAHWLTTMVSIMQNPKLAECVGFEGAVEALGNGVWDEEVSNKNGKAYLTCHMIYKKDIFERLGGFDTAFEKYGLFCEDHEFAARILSWGEIPFCKQLLVRHQSRRFDFFRMLSSASRNMRHLLHSECYFFMRHPDRYHQFRYRRHFLFTYADILLKHTFTSFRRRSFRQLSAHPLQAVTFFVASILEQVTAWACVPKLMRALFTGGHALYRHIDVAHTKQWYATPKSTIVDWTVKPSAFKSLTFPLFHAPVYSAVRASTRIAKKRVGGRAQFFVRLDDIFLDSNEDCARYATLFKHAGIPVLGALPGKYFSNPGAILVCEALIQARGTLGLHGFNHEGMFGPFMNEISSYTFPLLHTAIDSCLREFPKHLHPKAFIPPFNGLGSEHILYLSRIFPIVCGGPETVRFTDGIGLPVQLVSGGWYVPSLSPWYGKAKDLLCNGLLENACTISGVNCCTFHAPYEWEYDKFESLYKVFDSIKSYAGTWDTFTSSVVAQ